LEKQLVMALATALAMVKGQGSEMASATALD
jgi:hypothetical protein